MNNDIASFKNSLAIKPKNPNKLKRIFYKIFCTINIHKFTILNIKYDKGITIYRKVCERCGKRRKLT